MSRTKRVVLWILAAVLLIALLVTAYFIYFYATKCEDQTCFSNALVNCKRTSYTDASAETIIRYKIHGTSGDKCQINVEMLQVKKGAAELAALEGTEMECLTAIGIFTQPEKNLNECHGRLKEEIQNIIIKRMHTQIVENLGKISEETTKII